MKYKQVCPECYFEIIVPDANGKVKKCPNCNGRDIVNQKLTKVESEDSEKLKVTTNDNMVTEPIVTPWIDFEDDNTDVVGANENITFKYVSGIINRDFEIIVTLKDGEKLLGRSAMGQEYFQLDNRISNEHFYVNYKNGNWLIRDNESTNGTRINGDILHPNIEYKIKSGDIITLGKMSNSTRLEVNIC